MAQSLNNIYLQTGFTVREFTQLAQKADVYIVRNRIVELVKMYRDNPKKLDNLVQSIVEDQDE